MGKIVNNISELSLNIYTRIYFNHITEEIMCQDLETGEKKAIRSYIDDEDNLITAFDLVDYFKNLTHEVPIQTCANCHDTDLQLDEQCAECGRDQHS